MDWNTCSAWPADLHGKPNFNLKATAESRPKELNVFYHAWIFYKQSHKIEVNTEIIS